MSTDNTILKDGIANQFSLRAKDISPAGDGSLRRSMVYSTCYPVDCLGSFGICSKSGVMTGGLAANSPIYAFRWPSATANAILKRVRLSAWGLGTAFAAGIATFDLFRATAWTVSDTGGVVDTISLQQGKMRTSLGSTLLSEIRHSSTAALTAGTRSLDVQPQDTLNIGVGTVAYTAIFTRSVLFDRAQGEYPLVFASNEGFVIQATVPATGTWSFAITSEWDEVSLPSF
jgi:hypothetical protein